MTSTSGRPVSGSIVCSTVAVISIRYDVSSHWFHSAKTALSSAAEAESAREKIVGFGDELHVAVLDSVVHHVDKIAGAPQTHVLDALRSIIGQRRNCAQDGRERLPRLVRSARHAARTAKRSLLAAGH